MTIEERKLIVESILVSVGIMAAVLEKLKARSDTDAVRLLLEAKEALGDCATFIAADLKIDELEGGK